MTDGEGCHWPQTKTNLWRTSVRAQRGCDELVLEIEGYEGPIDILLTWRVIKRSTDKISILELAEQYLASFPKREDCVSSLRLIISSWQLGLPISNRAFYCQLPEKRTNPTQLKWPRVLRINCNVWKRCVMSRKIYSSDSKWIGIFSSGVPRNACLYRSSVFDHSLRTSCSVRRFPLAPGCQHPTDRSDGSVLDRRCLSSFTWYRGQCSEWTDLSSFLPPGLRITLSYRSAVATTSL